jgi:succinoglycan biosynthesis transport protein ExoP
MLTWREIWSFSGRLLRWWPILALAAILSAGTAWYLTRRQPAYYEARSTLMVGNNFTVSAPNQFAVEVSNSLARYYEVLVRREVILQPAVDQLQLPLSWRQVGGMIETLVNPRANLLEIVVTDSSPERAAAIANTLGEQLIAYSPNAPEKVAAERAEIDRQLAEAQRSIESTELRLEELQQRQQDLTAAVDLRENQEQIAELERVRDRALENYNQLLTLQNSSSTSTLSFFERASVPERALPEKTRLVIGGAGLGGLIVAIIAVFLLDLLDDRWRGGADLQRRTGIRDLGRVIYTPGYAGGDPGEDRDWQRAVRETHTQLVLANTDQQPRLLLVSSPEPSASRSAYTIDLAGIYGQSGHRVLLVDAELAQPYVSTIVSGRQEQSAQTLPELWSGRGHLLGQIPRELLARLRPTNMANVALLPGREPGDEQPILVPLLHWPELINRLRLIADVVILDGPSALSSADAALLAPLVDGVVLVLDQQRDSLAAITESKARLERSPQSRLLGAVTVAGDRSLSTRQRSRHRRFSVSVGRDGVTITVPSKGDAPRRLLEDRRQARPDEPAVEFERSVGEAGAVGQPMEISLEELIARSRQQEARKAPGPARRVIITPPGGADEASSPDRVLVTPSVTGQHPRRRTARGSAGRRRSRGPGARKTEE